MKSTIEPYRPEHVPAVRALNARLASGGSAWSFYDSPDPQWLGGNFADSGVSRSYHLAIDEAGHVHGGFVKKRQMFRLGGEEIELLTWQGPVSEGLIDKRHARIGMQCLLALRDTNPLLFGWGGSDRLNQLLDAFGWIRWGTPLFLRIVSPARVLRKAPFVRKSKSWGRVADVLAGTGLGGAAIQAGQGLVALHEGGGRRGLQAHRVETFGAWADEIWECSHQAYSWVARRDRAALDHLMGQPGWPDARIFKLMNGNALLGWFAVRISDLENDKRFGNLRVGSIIDALTVPGFETEAVSLAVQYLADEGADLIGGHLSHSVWKSAMRRAGFFEFAGQRPLYLAPDLVRRLAASGVTSSAQVHLMPIDGDGPMGF